MQARTFASGSGYDELLGRSHAADSLDHLNALLLREVHVLAVGSLHDVTCTRNM